LWDVEAPTFSLDNRLTDGDKVASLKRRPPFTPQEDSWYSLLLGLSRPQGHRAAGKIYLIGTRTRDLLACSIVPQPTTLPRTPQNHIPRGNTDYSRFCLAAQSGNLSLPMTIMMITTLNAYFVVLYFPETTLENGGSNAHCSRSRAMMTGLRT
jgi:hypothetical protein